MGAGGVLAQRPRPSRSGSLRTPPGHRRPQGRRVGAACRGSRPTCRTRVRPSTRSAEAGTVASAAAITRASRSVAASRTAPSSGASVGEVGMAPLDVLDQQRDPARRRRKRPSQQAGHSGWSRADVLEHADLAAEEAGGVGVEARADRLDERAGPVGAGQDAGRAAGRHAAHLLGDLDDGRAERLLDPGAHGDGHGGVRQAYADGAGSGHAPAPALGQPVPADLALPALVLAEVRGRRRDRARRTGVKK